MLNHRPGDDIFHKSYLPGGIGSGRGSDPNYTKDFRQMLEAFMKEHDVKTVLDYGCGDWKWTQHVNWGDREYLGVDIVPICIEQVRRKFGADHVKFETIDPSTWEPEGHYDLTICKDVLHHLPNEEAVQITSKLLAVSEHVLFISDKPNSRSIGNGDTRRGGYRGLDMTQPPFGLEGSEVFSFERSRKFPEDKVVFLARGGPEGTTVMTPPEVPKGGISQPSRGRGEGLGAPARRGGFGGPTRHGMG